MTIDKLAWIYIKDKKLLCARSKGKDIFYNPGGKREAGETDEQALVREIKEELNVDLVPGSLRYFDIFEAPAHGKEPGVMVRMICYTGDFVGTIAPSSEIEEIAWLTSADGARTSDAGRLVLGQLKERGLIE